MKRDASCPVCGTGEITIFFDPFSRSAEVLECLNCQAELALHLGEGGEVSFRPAARHAAAG